MFLANPQRFMSFSKWAAPIFGVLAVGMLGIGFTLGFTVPDDYQQGQTVRLLFLHPQVSFVSMMAYAAMGVSAFFGVVFRHLLADAAARAAAPIGAGFTFLALLTGAFWGRPMWGTWWEWTDPRIMSELVLFLFFLGYMALLSAVDDEAKATRAANILAMVGLPNLAVVHFSVYWWNSLHQGSSITTTIMAWFHSLSGGGQADKPGLAPVYVAPFVLSFFGLACLFAALWLVRIRSEVWRRKAQALAVQAAGKA